MRSSIWPTRRLRSPAGALSDRWPRARVYALGLICFAIGYIGLAVADTGWISVLLLLVYGGFAGITDGVGKAWISSLCPPDQRGHAQGLMQGLTGGAILLAGVWAGLAWTSGSGLGTVPMMIAGIVSALAAIGLLMAGRRPRIGHQPRSRHHRFGETPNAPN